MVRNEKIYFDDQAAIGGYQNAGRATGFMPVGFSAQVGQRNNNYVNQITRRTLIGQSPVAFEYDGHSTSAPGNGNLTNDGTLEYEFDVLNRLIAVYRVSDGLPIAAYVYDAANRRVRKTITNGGVIGNVPNGTTDYSGAAAQTGMGQTGFRAAEDSGFHGRRPNPRNIWQGWQTAEERDPFFGSGSTDTPEGLSGAICIALSLGIWAWTFGARACWAVPGGQFRCKWGMGVGQGIGASVGAAIYATGCAKS